MLTLISYNQLPSHLFFFCQKNFKQYNIKFLLFFVLETINSTFSTSFPNSTTHICSNTFRVPKITELLFPEMPAQNGLDTQLEKHQLSVRFNCGGQGGEGGNGNLGKVILEKEEVYCKSQARHAACFYQKSVYLFLKQQACTMCP